MHFTQLDSNKNRMQSGIKKSLCFFILLSLCFFSHCQSLSQKDKNLLSVAQDGQTSVIQALLREGANPNVTGEDGVTPLIYSISINNLKGVSLLLRSGADPNKSDVHSRGPLFFTLIARNINTDLVARLLRAGADPNRSKSMRKIPALHFAITSNNLDLAKLLLRYKAEIDATVPFELVQKSKVRLLMIASAQANLPFVKLFLAKGADANATDSKGDKAIDYAKAALSRLKGPAKDLSDADKVLRKNPATSRSDLGSIIRLLKARSN